MFQFFVTPEQINETTHEIIITGSDQNHLQNVLRMKVGEEVLVSNGIDEREFCCEVKEFLEHQAVLTIRYVQDSNAELPCKIHLFQGLPKFDKMEFIIQKAVELGVYEVIPMATKRCIVKLDHKKSKSKVERWQSIATAAAKQSKRGVIPTVSPVTSIQEAIERASHMDMAMIPYEMAKDMLETKRVIERIYGKREVAVFIGPEGGFDKEEITLAIEAGIIPITLGKRILRTETAGMSVLSLIMYHLEVGNI